jgi:hypothetical protein
MLLLNLRKRKASADLSTNLHTVKARTCEANIAGIELQIEKAKKADQAAVIYILGKMKKTKE